MILSTRSDRHRHQAVVALLQRQAQPHACKHCIKRDQQSVNLLIVQTEAQVLNQMTVYRADGDKRSKMTQNRQSLTVAAWPSRR
jgi:hypothetical protein